MSLQKRKKKRRWILLAFLVFFLISVPFLINSYVKTTTEEYLITEKTAAALKPDCILVLGAGVKPDGSPSLMLKDRLDKGIALYRDGVAPKLLLSGDNGQVEYDEVNTMKEYALDAGVPSEDIFLDHAGFSTYESMYRAKDIFLVKRPIIITQKYHQYRSLYIARGLGLDGYGVMAAPQAYRGQA